MRTLKLWIGIGKGAAEEFEIPILDDDATLSEISEMAYDAFNDVVRFDWEVVDE